MSRRGATALAWTLFGLFVAMNAYTYVELFLGTAIHDEWFNVLAIGFALVGALIASRHPTNAVGWLLLTVSVVLSLSGVSESYVAHLDRPGRAWVGWVSAWSWHVWVALIAIYLPLLFPTGRPLSPRWRPVAWIGGLALLLNILATAIRPGLLAAESRVVNPVGIEGAGSWVGVIDIAGSVTSAVACLLAACSMVLRLRRAQGTERQQLKWFALVGVVVVGALCLALVDLLIPGSTTDVLGAVGWFTFLAAVIFGVPGAVGVAILRHRLLDIDVVLNRTLVYGTLTLTLLASYVTCVLVLQLGLNPLTGGSDLAVAVSTLAVAALFRPLRSRVQGVVDRRFDRRRYDARRTVEDFAVRLRSELDLQAVGDDLRVVVDQTVQPSSVRLWLRSTP